MRQPLFLLCALLLMAGCGTKGGLTLPPGERKPPLLGNPPPPAPTLQGTSTAPVPQAKPAAPDNSNKASETK